VQWDATTHAGFSTASTWLPLADDYLHENVVNLDADATLILSLYKALITLMKRLPQLSDW
jgi:alpha-glucosidase